MPGNFKGPADKPWFPLTSPIVTLFGVAKIEPRFPTTKGRRRRDDVTEALALDAQGRSLPEIHRALGKTDPLEKRRLSDAMRQRKAREKRGVSEDLP